MKRRIFHAAFLVAALFVTGVVFGGCAKSGGNAWKKLYTEELKKHTEDLSPKFNLYDIDGDGVPELLFSDAEVHPAKAEIFTVIDGKLIDLGGYGSFGDVKIDPISRYIFSGYTGQGYSENSFCQLSEGKITTLVTFNDNTGAAGEPDWMFEINGKTVPKEEYDKEYAKYDSDNYIYQMARVYDVTETEISRVIGE